jgi:protein-S-isoprenylcysteine O-methyltransferase Ste14
MALYEEFVQSGQWLFQRRGFLPLVGVALLFTQVGSVAIPGSPPAVPLTWPLACFGISLVGLAIRAYTVGCAAPGTSGRNRAGQVAASLNSTGVYSVVRHPLYLGNCIGWLGPVLVPQRAWPAAVLGLAFWLYYERIMFAEEAFLRTQYGQPYLDWAAETPAFLPDLRRWRASSTPFNIWVVLRREYSSLLQLVLIFAALNVAQWWVSYHQSRIDPVWAGALIVGALLATVLRLLRRHTRLLEDRQPAAA